MNAGFVKKEGKDLPAGIQFIAPWFQEENIFTIANELEAKLNAV